VNPAAGLSAGADAGFRKHALESFLRTGGTHLNASSHCLVFLSRTTPAPVAACALGRAKLIRR
jgi:hypothetical protein